MQCCTLVRRAVSSTSELDAFETATRGALGIENGAAGPLHGAAYVLFRHRVLRRLRGAEGGYIPGPFQAFLSSNLRVACAETEDGLEMRAEVLFPELPPELPPSPPRQGKRAREREDAPEPLQFELDDVTATCGAGGPRP